eukprot:1004826-Amorphochlora_amoeboformis.AAC.1
MKSYELRLATKFEHTSGMRFDYIVRLRPDFLWMRARSYVRDLYEMRSLIRTHQRANISIVLDGADRPGDSDFSSNNSTSNPKSRLTPTLTLVSITNANPDVIHLRGILWTPPASFIKAKQINDWAVFCRRDECD